MGNFGDKWVVGVGVSEHRADGEEDLEILVDAGSNGREDVPFEMVKAGDH